MKIKKQYPINQSPFYKLSNHQRLANILGTDLRTLSRVVKRRDENYKFGHTDSGRAIQIPKAQLLRFHARINRLLVRISTPDYLVSGVKGRSHVYNAKQHVGEVAVAKTDIAKFYPSTTTEIVRKGLRKKFKCSNDIAKTLASLCSVNGHVPTGSPISQSLCFIVNAPVFDHLNIYARSRGLTFSLYVDDLTFSGKVLPKNFLSYVANYLERTRGYRCHKFRTYGNEKEKVITGVVVKSDNIQLKNSQRLKIFKLFKSKAYYSNAALKNDPLTVKYFQELIGHLFSAGQISPRYKQFGREVVEERKLLEVRALNQNIGR